MNSMAVSFLNDQLADMKRQISRTLGENPSKQSNAGSEKVNAQDFAMQRADEAVREINSSVLGLRPSTGTNGAGQQSVNRGNTPGKYCISFLLCDCILMLS